MQQDSQLADTSTASSMPSQYQPTRPYLPATSSYGPMPNLMAPHQRSNHVNYIPTSGNAPLMNDYANMPCNLQERMIIGQQGAHGFSLEETLANLPYDAIQRAISNNSGWCLSSIVIIYKCSLSLVVSFRSYVYGNPCIHILVCTLLSRSK